MKEKNMMPLFDRTMDSFVVGESNKHAYEIIHNAFWKRTVKNPIVVSGPTGVGKTHLLVGMANEQSTVKTVFMCTSDIINELLMLIKENGSLENDPMLLKDYFTYRFIEYDVVVMDNLHVLIGKAATQEIFCEIIKILIECEKQVVVLTDTSLDEYEVLSKKMKETFAELIVCIIENPNDELKKCIIDMYAKRSNVSFENDVINWLISQSDTVPYIIGLIKKILIITEHGKKVSLSTIKDIVKER